MAERATCWSITINNPSKEELNLSLPAGWSMTGQMERGEEGTEHYQGMLKTSQVRFSAVKKIFPRAHIEVCRNRSALEKYVHKDETRVSSVPDNKSVIPTLFDYQHTIARRWDDVIFRERVQNVRDLEERHRAVTIKAEDDIAMDYLDELVGEDIVNGVCGVEYIAINPMWRSAWKKFWRQLIIRERMVANPLIVNETQTEQSEEE